MGPIATSSSVSSFVGLQIFSKFMLSMGHGRLHSSKQFCRPNSFIHAISRRESINPKIIAITRPIIMRLVKNMWRVDSLSNKIHSLSKVARIWANFIAESLYT